MNELGHLEWLLARTPVVVQGIPLALGTLAGVEIVVDGKAFRSKWDEGSISPARQYALLSSDQYLLDRFPAVCLTDIGDTRNISGALFDRLHTFEKLILTQSDISARIGREASPDRYDVVILVVADGLSYRDCSAFPVAPCLVPGVTNTVEGFQRAVGYPSVAYRLFRRGYEHRIGYSMWNKDEDKKITAPAFDCFASNEMVYWNDFDTILGHLEATVKKRMFVQITMLGVDRLAHHSGRDKPMLDLYVREVFARFDRLEGVLVTRRLSGLLCAVSDHGILWRWQHELQVIPNTLPDPRSRYVSGHHLRTYLRTDSYGSDKYSLVKYPYILKPLAVNQWGVHGGVSYEESVVPYYERKVVSG